MALDVSTVSGISPPISAAWLYMSDDQDYNSIPQQWLEIDFRLVDVLFVGPLGLQADGTFGLYDSDKTGPLASRLRWVLQTARSPSQNPGIKIIVSQWWGSAPTIWGSDLSNVQSSQAAEQYADSVQVFLRTWLSVFGGIDGFDIDYEAGNVVENAPVILARVRSKLDGLSKAADGRPFFVTVSPSEVDHLQKAVPFLSYVNMQTYAGGYDLTPEIFLDMKLKSKQLLYGICPETGGRTRSVKEVEDEYTNNNLAGIHLWRLNSDNYKDELKVQKDIFAFLHPSS